MIAHGDDTYKYKDIRLNFSSNIYNHFNHKHLFSYLSEQMLCIASYPEPTPASLELRLAESLNISADNILVSNGATEAIYIIAQAFCHHTPIIPQPTFSEYGQASAMHHRPLAHTQEAPAIHWICNPNNPTGTVIKKEELLGSIKPRDIYVIDQSYAPYYDGELLTPSDVISRDNIILLHSMTKEYGIPGLRLGYAISNKSIIERLRQFRMPWSVNALAIRAGHYLLDHNDEYEIPVCMLNEERKRMTAELTSTGMIDVHPSDTHILLCHLHRGSASNLKERLANEHGILIRDASNFDGLDEQYFRIAVQRPAENDDLIASIKTTIEHS